MDRVPNQNQQESGEGRWNWRRCAAIYVAGLALAATGVWQYLDRSGETDGYIPQNPVPAAIGSQLNVGSWNMHNETAERVDQIAKVISYGRLDVMALQEVSREDLDDLEDRFSGWHMLYVMADAKAKPLEGGFGNVLMSRQKPEDVETVSLSGTSLMESVLRTAEGLVVDVAHADTSLENTQAGRQEDRAALASTIEAKDSDKTQAIRIITSHISGEPGIHEEQREGLLEFSDDNKRSDRPAIFIGDLNGRPETIDNVFGKIGFAILHTTPTSIEGKTIDYCAENDGEGILQASRADVLPNPKSDHHPIICSWRLVLPQ